MRLETLAASVVSWGQFKSAYPNGLVLSRDQGFSFRYEINTYESYDSGRPYAQFFSKETDPRLQPNERVVAMEIGSEQVAYAFSLVQNVRVIHDTRNDVPLVIFWTPGIASALDARSIEEGRDVGSVGVFSPLLDGRTLTLIPNTKDDQTFLDTQTMSIWNIFGKATAGELAGYQLDPIVHGTHFWFAWAAFFPSTELVQK